MAKYKTYPEYKDSGVEWLGKVPKDWNILSLKSIALIVNGSTPKSGVEEYWDGDINWITPTDLSQTSDVYLNDSQRKITYQGLNSCGTSLVPEDTVILSTRAPIGSLAITTIQSCTNQGCKSLVVKNKIHSLFLYYYLSISTNSLNNLGRGSTFLELSTEDLGSFKVSIPDIGIEKIVTFLSYETAKIDSIIEKQQQLIELLKEKRQAVISHAVTKGLNPNVPMKYSGVEWLGDVPKHWKCGYLRWYISVSSGTYLNNKDFETDESNDCINPVIGGNGVMGFTSKINDGNCLVVGRVGALCGNVHQIRRACWVTDNALKITYSCDFDVDYLEMYLKVLDLNKLANHNAQPLITGAMIKEQVAIIPSMDEQKNITKFIQSKVGKIDLLIRKSSKAVDKIKERRTALISAAVTGKIDVRDWVAPDTQETEKIEETAE